MPANVHTCRNASERVCVISGKVVHTVVSFTKVNDRKCFVANACLTLVKEETFFYNSGYFL